MEDHGAEDQVPARTEEEKEEARREIVATEVEVSCHPIYGDGDGPELTGFFSSGHSCDYIDASASHGARLFVFGGHVGRYAGRDDGAVRTNQLLVLHNAHTLGADEASTSPTWEKVSLGKVKGRAGHASFVRNGKLYIHGGYDTGHRVLSDLIEIDPSSSSYEYRSVPYESVVQNVERRWHCSYHINNKLILHGGWNSFGALNSLVSLDLDTMKWDTLAWENGPSPRRWHTLSPMPGHPERLFSYGGYDAPKHPLNDSFILDLGAQQWVEPVMRGDIPGPLCRHTLTTLPGQSLKQMILIGGSKNDGGTNKEIRILHTDDMRWELVKDAGHLFPVIRRGHLATPVGDRGIVISGGFAAEYITPFYWLDARMLR